MLATLPKHKGTVSLNNFRKPCWREICRNYHIYLKLMIDGALSRPFSAGSISPARLN